MATTTPDPKPAARVRDPALLKRLHMTWRECALCGYGPPARRLSLHHIHKHPRDDVEANMVMLCGDGVQHCHGRVEAGHRATRSLLVSYLRRRPETMRYLAEKLGGKDQADAWLQRQA